MENCAYLRKNPGYAPESFREMFQRRKAGTKETIIKYRISSETFKKFARDVQSTLYQTQKDINY